MGTVQVLFVVLALASVQGQREVFVEIEQGIVEGRSFELHTGNTVNRFWGIPFAKPPVGELRFKPPEDPEPFENGFFEANKLPPSCPQGGGLFIWTHPFWKNFKEDCLNLNVFAPNDTSGGPYPVMFFIHGGGYVGSGNIQYPGYFLAEKGVVMVATNYRLGNLGFFSTGDDVAPGNYGILDQIQALKWVQRNIAAFGGDPNDVTLFGQSAGGSSIGILLVSPLAEGLFHGAILESGTELAVWAVYSPLHEPENYSKQIAAGVNCTTEDNEEMMACMREKDADDIIKVGFTCKPGQFCQGLAPVIDGYLLTDMPIDLRSQGKYKHIPIINGQTSDDGSLYTVALIPESLERGFYRDEFVEIIRENLVKIFSPNFPDKEDEVVEALNFYYSPYPNQYDLDENREAFNVLITDFGFSTLGDQTMKYHSATDDVYSYNIGIRSKNADRVVPAWLGVIHNGELPYVVGYPMIKKNFAVRLDCQIIDIINWDDEDFEYADFVMTLWTNFAKYKNPTPEPVPGPFGQPPVTWPTFNRANQTRLQLDYNVELKTDYRQKNFAFWLKYGPYITGIDFFPYWNDTVNNPHEPSSYAPRKPMNFNMNDTPKTQQKGMSSKMVEENLQKLYDLMYENYKRYNSN